MTGVKTSGRVASGSASGPGCVTGARADGERTVTCANLQRPPSLALARCLERKDVLMSKLVNDLPRGKAGVRGGAGDEHRAARPLREIRKRAGHFRGHGNR